MELDAASFLPPWAAPAPSHFASVPIALALQQKESDLIIPPSLQILSFHGGC